MSDDSPKIQKTDEKFAWLEKLRQCTTWLDQRIAQPEKTRFYHSRNETEAFSVVSSELEPMKHVQRSDFSSHAKGCRRCCDQTNRAFLQWPIKVKSVIIMTNQSEEIYTKNQSEHRTNRRYRSEARENACDQVVTGCFWSAEMMQPWFSCLHQ